MNERIKLLALEAGLVRNGDFGMKRWEGPRSDSISDQDLEKFAELIVKECIEAIQNESMNSYDDWERGLRIAEGAIEKHFGVEE